MSCDDNGRTSAVQGGARGFSLVELSIVLIVVGLLTSATLTPLKTQIDRSRVQGTQRALDAAREALIGHVIATGVLPCPVNAVTSTLNGSGALVAGTTAFASVGVPVSAADQRHCKHATGALPAAALGLSGATDARGTPLDAWGNSLHYAVSLADHPVHGEPGLPDWTSPGEPGRVGVANLDADLSLCSEAAAARCPRDALRADQIVAVIWSTGADASRHGIQAENQDGDAVFAVAGFSQTASTAYDDQVLWLSRSELSYWLLRANWLD